MWKTESTHQAPPPSEKKTQIMRFSIICISLKNFQARTEFIKIAASIPINSTDSLEQNNELMYSLMLAEKDVAIEAQVNTYDLHINVI